nr:chromatin regulatory protein sir2 [Hymenolepis microstoma]
MSKANSYASNFSYYYGTLYLLLASLRIFFAFTHSPGYIYPDEIFQSIELVTHDVYPNSCSLLTWDFKPFGYGPVRSRSSIYPFVHLPISIVNNVNPPRPDERLSGNDMINRILIPARIFTTLLSFVPDAFIFFISKKLENLQNNQMPLSVLLYSSMAYGGLLYNTRTLSNIWETVLVCIFCYLSLHSSFLNVLLEAAIGAYGIFLRSSFPLFVAPFIFLQLYNISSSPHRIAYLTHIIPIAVLTSCAVSGLLIFFDTKYYSGNQIPELSDFIVTPLRFLKYNSMPETLIEHGLHPWYHYLIVHWPLILTPVVVLFVLIPPARTGYEYSLRFTLWLSIVFPTLFLSLCPHKETRYIIPSLPFAACLASLRVKRLRSLLVHWIVYQAALVVFWGYLHQAGILPFLKSIPANDVDEVSLNIFYKTYMPPRFAFGEPRIPPISIPGECRKLAPFDNDGCDRVLDFSGRPQIELFNFLDCLKIYALPNTVIRVILPGTLLPLHKSLSDYGEVLRLDTFFPHLSTENLPSLTMPNCSGNANYMVCLSAYWELLRNQLSLHSHKIILT